MQTDELSESAPGLYRYALTLTRNREDAEDLVSDTLVRALERQESFREDSSLATWLHRIMHNLAVDKARRRREEPEDVETVAREIEARWRDDSYTVDAEKVALRAQDSSEVREALLRLPVDYRAAVVMHDMAGMSGREISEAQGVSLPAAKQRMRRGRMMLVSALASGAERREALKGVPLNCWDARGQIGDYLDDLVSPETRAVLEAHLARCPTCPPLLSGIQASSEAVSDLRDSDSVLPAGIARRLLAFSAEE